MQKVITVTIRMEMPAKADEFKEKEYPTLTKYLEEGYKVVQITPVLPTTNTIHGYSLTFLLEKQD